MPKLQLDGRVHVSAPQTAAEKRLCWGEHGRVEIGFALELSVGGIMMEVAQTLSSLACMQCLLPRHSHFA